MCKYCDEDSYCCEIYKDDIYETYYLDVQTYEWDPYEDGYVRMYIDIEYCPYCGRKLNNEVSKDEVLRRVERHDCTGWFWNYLRNLVLEDIKRRGD